jgi:hypothetical protein
LIAAQKHAHVRDVLAGAVSTHGNDVAQSFPVFASVDVIKAAGVDNARANGVDANA